MDLQHLKTISCQERMRTRDVYSNDAKMLKERSAEDMDVIETKQEGRTAESEEAEAS